jgi:hypothetical protein
MFFPKVLQSMSKAKKNRRKELVEQQARKGRRNFLALGLGGLGTMAIAGLAGYKAGWFDSWTSTSSITTTPTPSIPEPNPLPPATLPADYPNALRAADDFVRHYARELKTPSSLIHAVRAFGKNFALDDGAKAVDVLCSRYAAEKEVNGKRYVSFPREVEVHDNSFLKTMLEAGVSLDQPITVGANKRALRDLGESGKALFRCDPQNLQRYDSSLVHQHLPWTLIAFTILTPPAQSTWVNAYGETINLPEVINRGLAVYEGVSAGVKEGLAQGEMETLEFRQQIAKYSCYGMHMFYGFFVCLKNGYRNDNVPKRLDQMMDSLLYRLKGDSLAIDREADAAKGMGPEFVNRLAIEGQGGKIVTKGAAPSNILEVMRYRSQIKMLGHAFEAINFGMLHKLFTPKPDQKKRMREGEQMLYDYLIKLRATDLAPYLRWYPKFVNDTTIAVAHASRAMKLLTPDNPDTIA